MDDNRDNVFGFQSGDLISVLSDLKSWEVIRTLHADEAKNKTKDTYSFSYNYQDIEELEPTSTSHTLGDRILSELDLYGYDIKKPKILVKGNSITYEFKIRSNNANCLSGFIEMIQDIDSATPGFLPSMPSLIKALKANGSAKREFLILEQGIADINVYAVVEELGSMVGVNALAEVNPDNGKYQSVLINFDAKAVYRYGKTVESNKLQLSKSRCWTILS